MKLKTLLLGSAAALLTVGAAQAADLGAEPANYVKVCDAFGPGFYYAPGTDTCIKISGYVLFDVNIGNFGFVGPGGGTATLSATNHYFEAWAAVQVTASSMTEYGPLVGFIELWTRGASPTTGPGVAGLGGTIVDDAWLSLGPFLAGYTWSIFNPAFDPSINQLWNFTGNTRLLQARLSWAANGLGLAIAAEDYASRIPGNIASAPDITAALNGSWGNLGLHLGAGWGQRPAGTVANTWGLSGNVRIGLDALAPGDSLTIGANYSSGGDEWLASFFGPITGVDGLNHWSVYGWFTHNWTSQVSTSISAAYRNDNNVNTMNMIVGNLTYRPVTNFSIAGELVAANSGGATPYALTGKIRVRRDFP
jgi:hypothetical protein